MNDQEKTKQELIDELKELRQRVSKLEAVEEALRESEERYHSLFEGSRDAIYLTAREGRLDAANQAFLDLFGFTREEVRDLNILNVYRNPADRPRFQERIERHGSVKDYEVKFQKKDGTEIDCLLTFTLRRGKDGNILGYQGIARDITELEKAEETLRLSETKFLDLYENAPCAYFSVGTDSIIRLCNCRAGELLGYARKELIGKPVFELYADTPDGKEKAGKVFKRLVAGEPIVDEELQMQKADGSAVWVSLTVNGIRDPMGHLVESRSMVLDISDRKRGEEKRESLTTQLLHAQKMEAVGTLAGGIAHDFNNLLQVIVGYSEWLLALKTEEDPDRADLTNIFQAAKSGADLVHRLLAFSRRVEPQTIPLNLNQRIQQMKSILRRTIPRMIEITFDLSWALPTVKVDPTQIELVVINLAVNARDAMPEGGKLIIKTERVRLDEAFCKTCSGLKPGQYAALLVTDTGHGMDSEVLQHIFEPFYTTKGLGRGTGLGLAITYNIIKQHGGQITCVSQAGRGTTFSIYLPAVDVEQAQDLEHSGEIPALGIETVLLVDDEDLVRHLGERILTQSGYTVLTASDGREALDLYKRERDRIHLVILDLIMPEMGGKQCLEEILKINPKAKVLIASGYSEDLPTRESLEMRVKGFVGKPFRGKKLLRDIRRALGKRQLNG